MLRKKRLRKRSKKAGITKVLDDLCRQIILNRDGHRCRRCGKGKPSAVLQASHVYPRGSYPSLRWEPQNIVTLCVKCHLYWWHRNPIEAMQWIESELGRPELDRLKMIGLTRGKTDKKALKLYLENLIRV